MLGPRPPSPPPFQRCAARGVAGSTMSTPDSPRAVLPRQDGSRSSAPAGLLCCCIGLTVLGFQPVRESAKQGAAVTHTPPPPPRPPRLGSCCCSPRLCFLCLRAVQAAGQRHDEVPWPTSQLCATVSVASHLSLHTEPSTCARCAPGMCRVHSVLTARLPPRCVRAGFCKKP